MGRAVYKPNRDKDEYVIWSTVVDSPVSDVLTREEMLAVWNGGKDSLDRADKYGHSWQDPMGIPIGWGEQEYIREINVDGEDFDGYCRFEDIADIVRADNNHDAETLRRLIVPIEDE